jgi:hypothetical protein
MKRRIYGDNFYVRTCFNSGLFLFFNPICIGKLSVAPVLGAALIV